MTQEDKELLLKDLSARLPYGVVMNTPNGNGHLCSINQTIFGNKYGINISATRRDYFNDEELNFKPYLRPMSSMTEEEKKDFDCNFHIGSKLSEHYFAYAKSIIKIYQKSIDWLNAHHFDYRNLIEKGLALKAPKELYKY